jgi:hypothetical protein
MTLRIETPDHERTLEWINERNITFAELQSVVIQMADVAGYSMIEDLGTHVRTGQTIQSIEAVPIELSETHVAYFVGSRQRGQILRWLDKGRGEVRPKHLTKSGQLGYLRFLTYPEGLVIFTRYSRPTVGIGLIEKAANRAMARVSNIIGTKT